MAAYGQSKYCAERYLGLYERLYGLSTMALRFGNVYGPRQDPHGEAGVIAIFCGRLLAGERPRVYGDGSQTRDYIYVADLVEALLAAGDSDGGRRRQRRHRGRDLGAGAARGPARPPRARTRRRPSSRPRARARSIAPASTRRSRASCSAGEASTPIAEGLRLTYAAAADLSAFASATPGGSCWRPCTRPTFAAGPSARFACACGGDGGGPDSRRAPRAAHADGRGVPRDARVHRADGTDVDDSALCGARHRPGTTVVKRRDEAIACSA